MFLAVFILIYRTPWGADRTFEEFRLLSPDGSLLSEQPEEGISRVYNSDRAAPPYCAPHLLPGDRAIR